MTIEFRGGWWGGRTITEPYPPPREMRMVVPLRESRGGLVCYGENDTLPPPEPMYGADTYRLYRQETGVHYIYEWVDDRMAMRAQISRLESSLAAIRNIVNEQEA